MNFYKLCIPNIHEFAIQLTFYTISLSLKPVFKPFIFHLTEIDITSTQKFPVTKKKRLKSYCNICYYRFIVTSKYTTYIDLNFILRLTGMSSPQKLSLYWLVRSHAITIKY